MWNAVSTIGDNYEKLSKARKDKKQFISADFVNFAETNQRKYGLVNLAGILCVSTWHVDSLIQDYRQTL